MNLNKIIRKLILLIILMLMVVGLNYFNEFNYWSYAGGCIASAFALMLLEEKKGEDKK